MRAEKHLKKTVIGRVRFLSAAVLALVLLVSSASLRVAANTTPTMDIQYHNLSYSSQLYLMYAVRYENIDPNTTPVEMLFWNAGRADGYEKGTEDRAVNPSGKTKIGGKDYLVFYSDGLAPKQLTDELYCRTCVTIGDRIYYSDPIKYSPIKYISEIGRSTSASDSDKKVTSALRDYGAAAQKRFAYHPERLASAPYYNVTLQNAQLSDGFDYAFAPNGSVLTITADVPAGKTFLRWTDGDGKELGLSPELFWTVTGDVTIQAEFTDPATVLSGLSPTAADQYQLPYVFKAEPLTVEAEVALPTSLNDRGGVLLGNYGYGTHTFNLEIYSKGRLRLYFSENENVSEVLFNTDLRSDEAQHIAITIPQKNQLCKLYIDGVLAESKTMPCALPDIGDTLMVGGDYRSGNAQYFKGRIDTLAIYRGIRSDAQILSDAQSGADTESDDLAVSFVFSGANALCDRGACRKELVTGKRSGLAPATVSDRYSLTKTFAVAPRTYEALIDTTADVSNQKGCTIIGNYNDVYTPGISFRVYLNGRPSLCLRYDKEHQDQFTFPKSILGEGRVHVAITIDDTYVYGYLNGTQVMKKEHCGYLPELVPYPFSVGGDNRTDNTWWFRDGNIYSLNLFSEYRTAEQIAEDMNRIDATDPTLLLSYDFEQSFEDRSGQRNELKPYFYEKDFLPSSEYDYTFACIGDTQTLVKNYPEKVHSICDFILDHVSDMKIARVIGLGDMTEDNTADQWELVSSQMFRLDDIVPYTVIRGNHDRYARTTEAEATKELMFGNYFDNAVYQKQYDGSFDGTPTNTYKRFTAGGIQYLLLCLDYGPGDDVLAWASDVVASYPNDNVIVVTHAFLFHDGTTIDENDICPPRSDVGLNNCDEIWDKFVSQHENIVLVLSGHDPSNEIVVSKMTGVHGNTVTCCLIDPQHTDRYDRASGQVALLHFKDGGSTILIENYSTVEGKFYKTDNEITVTGVRVITAP